MKKEEIKEEKVPAVMKKKKKKKKSVELLFGKALKNCFFFKLKLCPQIFTWYWDNFILWKMVKKNIYLNLLNLT